MKTPSFKPTPLIGALAVTSLLLAACGDDNEPAEENSNGAVEHDYEDGDVITVVFPTAPGGGFDVQSQIMAPYLEENLRDITGADVSFRVEAMPGGAMLVGMQYVQNAEPDGRTLIYAASTYAMGHQVVEEADLQLDEFVPIGTSGVNPMSFVAPASLDLEPGDFEGLIEQSQEAPILIGNDGAEVPVRLMAGVLEEEGVEFNIDFATLEGTSGVVTSLLRDDVELGATSTVGVVPMVEENPDELEMFLGLGCEPASAAPDLPNITESGVPRADEICASFGEDWRALLATPGTPEGNAEVLTEAMRMMAEDEEFQQELSDTGFDPSWSEPEEFSHYLDDLIDTWTEVRHYATD